MYIDYPDSDLESVSNSEVSEENRFRPQSSFQTSGRCCPSASGDNNEDNPGLWWSKCICPVIAEDKNLNTIVGI